MAKRKIGWRMRLKRELRQNRAEEKIRAKDLAKRQEIQQKFLSDANIDEIKGTSAKIGAAEQQLSNDGYEVSGEPIETMAQYNDVYGNGNGDLDEQVAQSFEEDFQREDGTASNLESLQGAEAYSDLVRGVADIMENFEENFSKYNSEDLESYEENFGEKIKAKFAKFLGGGKKKSGGSENETVASIADDIAVLYPKKAEALRNFASKQNAVGGGSGKMVVHILIGAVIGYALSKVFKL